MNGQTTFNAISKVEVGLSYAHHRSPAVCCSWQKAQRKKKSARAAMIIFKK